MADKFTPEVRSKIMSAVKGENTSIELLVFNYLKRNNAYFQKHYTRIIGNPDIASHQKKKPCSLMGILA